MGLEAPFVTVRVVVGPGGVLRRVEASGHAGGEGAGSNPACAAVTVLLRSAWETMALYKGVSPAGSAASPGSLGFTLGRYPEEAEERLRGIADFLLVGISGVEREHPGKVHLVLEDERRT